MVVYIARLSNADQAVENLHFFDNSYQTEEPWLGGFERSVSRLAPVSGRLEDAQRDIEVVMVCCVHVFIGRRGGVSK